MDAKDLEKLLKSLRRRQLPLGIGTARQYVGALNPLLRGDPKAVEKYFGMGSTAAWASALKDAGKKLVYRDDAMVLTNAYRASDLLIPREVKNHCRTALKRHAKEPGRSRDLEICRHLLDAKSVGARRVGEMLEWFKRHPEPATVRHALRGGDECRRWLRDKARRAVKSDGDDSDLESDACMEFDCVLTSRSQDRDGDVLEPAGADVDPSMPLLWQHIPIQPIGKLIKVIDQDEDRVVTRFAVADTELGRDAAQLVAFGALRISHGFVPTEFEPLEEGGDEPGADEEAGGEGWHVLKYKVLEGSVVSIPSNPDAVITAYSRKCLRHPLVKGWAKGFFDRRRPIVRSGFRKPAGGLPVHVHVHL